MANRTAAQQEQWGNRLQTGADFLCHARWVGAQVLGAYNILSPQSRNWRSTAAVAANYATDKADGVLARRASVVLGRPPTNAGKKLDHTVDKAAHNSLATSHILTAFRRRERVFASVMAVCLGVQMARDLRVNSKREQAERVAADTGAAIHIGSIPISKYKMGLTAAADIGTQSPVAETRSGRLALGLTHAAATLLSLVSGARIIGDLDHGISDTDEFFPPGQLMVDVPLADILD